MNRSRQPQRGRPRKIPFVKQQLRNAILHGRIKPDEQLPSFFEVARQFGVAGLTAKRAIDELVKEGWLRSRNGVGTFVRVRKSASQIVLTAPREFFFEAFLSAETLDAFHAAHPHVRIIASSEPITDLLTTSSYGMMVQHIRDHSWRSLDGLRQRFHHQPWELPGLARKFGAVDGELHGLPLRVNLHVIQANRALLQRAGLECPDGHLTWEMYQEILRRCREDRDGDGIVECFGAFSCLDTNDWLIPFWQRGGRLDDEVAFFHPEAIAVLDDLCRMHHVEHTFPLEIAIGGGSIGKIVLQRFKAQRIALRWISAREIARELDFETEILLPRFGRLPRQVAEGLVLGIHSECDHPDVAMQFLDFCYQRFIRGNEFYPHAISSDECQFLRARSELHHRLDQGLAHASEVLREGHPERTWALENEIFQWYRLMQDRKTTVARLREHWQRWKSGGRGASSVEGRSPQLEVPSRVLRRLRQSPAASANLLAPMGDEESLEG